MPLFNRTSNEPAPAFPGVPDVADGHAAAMDVERRAGATAGAYPDGSDAAWLRVAETAEALGGRLAGWAASGLRAAAFTRGSALAALRASLEASAARLLPFVVHHAGALGDAFLETVPFVLAARTVQEAADFALLVRRIADETLVPGLVVQETRRTAASVQTFHRPEPALIDAFLGRPDDVIACPTPAQQILFGETRRRVPAWFDLDRPLGLGAALDAETALKAKAATEAYVTDHLADVADQTMAALAELTGRAYARATGYRLDDAEYVVVASGAISEDLEAVVDYVRRHDGMKAGAVHVTLLRPFPAALVGAMLRGKRAVTVLAPPTQGMAGDPPLLQNVRAALDEAVPETPKATRSRIWTTASSTTDDRPALLAGVYGEAYSFADLVGAFRTMLPGGAGTSSFFLGVSLEASDTRLPGLERLSQRIRQGYPDLAVRGLTGDSDAVPDAAPHTAVRIRTVRQEDGLFAGRLLARTFVSALGGEVRTHPEHDGCTVSHAEASLPPALAQDRLDALLLAAPVLLEDRQALAHLRKNGVVVLHTVAAPEDVWTHFSPSLRRAIRAQRPRLFILNARAVAEDLTDDPLTAPSLAQQALAGALLSTYPDLDDDARTRLADHYRHELGNLLGGKEPLLALHRDAFERGMADVTAFDWQAQPADEAPVPEPEAPWTVRAVPEPDGSVFDLARFWDDVGFLHETGRGDEALVDPFLATRALPARSSAFRSTAPRYDQAPRLLPENCTACGTCFALCPDAALPVTIQDTGALIDTALEACQQAGHDTLQLQRILPHLAKQAHRLAASDDLHRYRTLGALLEDAFAHLVDRMKPADDQRAALEAAFAPLRDRVATFPIVKTDTFFNAPEQAEKGSGLLFSLAVNPDACKACGLCVAACPDGALEMTRRDAAAVQRDRQNERFLMDLPDVLPDRITRFIDEENPETLAYHLLNRRVYHSLLGGDESVPGSGPKAALHLVLAAAEARMLPRAQALIEQMDDLIGQLERAVEERLTGAFHVDDLERLGRRLSDLEASNVNLETLAHLVEDETGPQAIDAAALARFTATLDDLKTLKTAYHQAAHGDGRARMGLALGGRDAPDYPYNPYPFPWLVHLPGDAPAVAEGLVEGLTRRMAETFKTLRRATLLAHNTYDPAEHDAVFERFGWDDLTPEERAACPPLVVVTDRGSETLAHALCGALPIKAVVLNAPDGTAGHQALTHRRAFVLQSTIGYPGHLLHGALDAFAFDGPALLHLYAPDPARHGLPPEQVYDQARRAVASRAFPLFVYDPRRGDELAERLDLNGNPDLDADWSTQTVAVETGGGLTRHEERPLTFADWAAREARFREHFRFVPRKDWSPGLVPVADVLAQTPEERTATTSYVEVPGLGDRAVRKTVSSAMVEQTEEHLATWRRLLEMAGLRSRLAERVAAEARAAMDETLARREAAINAEAEAEIARREATHAARYHAQLTQQLLRLSGFGTPEAAEETLRAFLRRDATNDVEA